MKLTLPPDQMNLLKCYESTKANYDTIANYSFCNSDGSHTIGNKEICKFCGKAKGETTFKNIAHTIPEALGNKKLFSNDECDVCNAYFGSYIENELAEFLSLCRSFGFVKGKKNKPHQKHYADNGKITTFHNQRLLRFSSEPGKEIYQDLGNHNAVVAVKNQKINHHKVMKAFSKIALALMPDEEVVNFEVTREWLFDKSYPNDKFPQNSYGMISIYSKTANPNNTITTVLLRRKEHLDPKVYPYVMIGIYFAHFTYFVPVQFSAYDDFNRKNLILSATHINKATIDMEQFQTLHFGNEGPTTMFDFTMSMSYENCEVI